MTQMITYRFPDGDIQTLDGKAAERWIIDFMGVYSSLQDCIGARVAQVIGCSSPQLGLALEKRPFSRLTDEDRWACVKALAKDTVYDGDMRAASTIFWRCKRTRDLVAHSDQLDYVFDTQTATYGYYVDRNDAKCKSVPDPLTPDSFRLLLLQCEWLRALVQHLASRAGIQLSSFMGHPHEDGSVHFTLLNFPDPGTTPLAWGAKIPQPEYIPCDDPGCTFKKCVAPS